MAVVKCQGSSALPARRHACPGPFACQAAPSTPGVCLWHQVAVAYAQRAQLDRGAHAPTHILLDTALCDALFKVLEI